MTVRQRSPHPRPVKGPVMYAVAYRAPRPVTVRPVAVRVPAPLAASAGAPAAVSTALAEVGKPYQWGGMGPRSFDCSGLARFAWLAGGIALPHSASAQMGSGRPVSRGALQPGDLVFFGRPAYHVGIYIGGDRMAHAPERGHVVEVVPVDQANYSGAIRPGS